MRKKFLVPTLFALGLMFTVYLCNGGPKQDDPIYKKELKECKIDVKDGTFSKQALKEELVTQGIKCPDIVYAQAKLETGNFTASIFLVKNNLFAFRGKNGYYSYDSWQESVKVYKLWQDEYYRDGDYYDFLDKIGYAEDSCYLKKVKACVE